MRNKNAPSDQHVIVIGAGYAGLMCALQLAPHARVTLVGPAGHFTERICSPELATGRPRIAHPLRGFLDPAGITQVLARVTGIVPGARKIRADDGLARAGGRIAVGPALRSVSDPGIYAAGDAAASVSPAAGQLRMACATALPTGPHRGCAHPASDCPAPAQRAHR